MKKVLIIESDQFMSEDIETQALIFDEEAYEFEVLRELENVAHEVADRKPDEIVISPTVLRAYPNWTFDVPVRSFAENENDILLSDERNVPCLGIIKTAGELLPAIVKDRTVRVTSAKNKDASPKAEQEEKPKANLKKEQNQESVEQDIADDFTDMFEALHEEIRQTDTQNQKQTNPQNKKNQKNQNRNNSKNQKNQKNQENRPQKNRNDRTEDRNASENRQRNRRNDDYYEDDYEPRSRRYRRDDDYDDYEDDYAPRSRRRREDDYDDAYDYRPRRRRTDDYEDDYAPRSRRRRDYEDDEYEYRPRRRRTDTYDDYEDDYVPRSRRRRDYEDDEYEQRPRRSREDTNTRQHVKEESKKEEPIKTSSVAERLAQSAKYNEQRRLDEELEEETLLREQAELEVDKDTDKIKGPAKFITIYSAKGGVGKTTIACELAVYLSRVQRGKDFMRVCIVDYNLDFGDVMQTLPFDPTHINLSVWASDIDERLRAGTAEEDINYSQTEIENFLQREEDSGLYGLLSPITHEDSMIVKDHSLRIMLRNIKENGGFDFVICDTGNNTRDATIIALDAADEVFQVMAQDLNTVNDNDSVIRTLFKIDYDMEKVHTIVNRVKSERAVGLSPEEVSDALKHPKSGVSFDCISYIREDDAVAYYHNRRQPVVFNSKKDFTTEIGHIASYVIGDDFALPEVKKQSAIASFFKKLFRRG